jgi:hypothetical protein
MNDAFCAKTKGAMANCKAARRRYGFIAEWAPQREQALPKDCEELVITKEWCMLGERRGGPAT